jgi:acyl carrier protein
MNGLSPELIREKVLAVYDEEGYDPDKNGKIEPGIADSLDAMHLLMAIEDEFGVEFPENIDSSMFLNTNEVIQYLETYEHNPN